MKKRFLVVIFNLESWSSVFESMNAWDKTTTTTCVLFKYIFKSFFVPHNSVTNKDV
jgi:hypothetical protein